MTVNELIDILEGLPQGLKERDIYMETEDSPDTSFGVDEFAISNGFVVLRSIDPLV